MQIKNFILLHTELTQTDPNPNPDPKPNTDPNPKFDTVTETRYKTINLFGFYSLCQPGFLVPRSAIVAHSRTNKSSTIEGK